MRIVVVPVLIAALAVRNFSLADSPCAGSNDSVAQRWVHIDRGIVNPKRVVDDRAKLSISKFSR
jgi:hypothetical protein